MQPAVFLDRDNTLIANDGDLGDPREVRLLDGVAAGLHALRRAEYRLVVITNQAGVARGLFSEHDVDAVHERIAELVDAAPVAAGVQGETAGEHTAATSVIDRFYYCPYHPEAALDDYRRDHPWRKPRPGMILQAARDMHLDLSHSWVIGDQSRDVLAGRAAGCRTILVGADDQAASDCQPTARAETFAQAVEIILRTDPSSEGNPPAVAGSPSTSTHHSVLPPRRVDSTRNSFHHANNRQPASDSAINDISRLRQVIAELGEELRTERARRADFTPLKLAAGVCQLLALLLALLSLLHLGQFETFLSWMAGAVLLQLVTITIMLADARG